MIYGIGLDIIEVDRVKRAATKESFIKKIFSDNEIAMFKKRNFSAQVIAGNFAAKEATLKAMGLGMSSGFIREIEILRLDSGQPYINLIGNAKKYAQENRCDNFFVSISNLKDIAAANVVIESDIN